MTGTAKEAIDNLILNYFITEGFDKAAVSFAKEINVDLHRPAPQTSRQEQEIIQSFPKLEHLSDIEFVAFMDKHVLADDLEQTKAEALAFKQGNYRSSSLLSSYSSIKLRTEIKILILKGDIKEAINKISQHFPTVLDSYKLFHFKLLKLNLIEMIRSHKLNETAINDNEMEKQFLDDTLNFVRENLINKVTSSSKLLKELEITMSLLCFNFDPSVKSIEDQRDLPEELRSLFDLSFRHQCYRLVNRAILDLGIENDASSTLEQAIPRGPRTFDVDIKSIQRDGSRLKLVNLDGEELYKADPAGFELPYLAKNIDDVEIARFKSACVDDNESKDFEKQQDLLLESALERTVKLWTTTEERLLDLNVILKKRFVLNEESV